MRVVLEPADFASLLPGEVLVCPYTNPSWTPLFERAAAVVVDTGGLASHAAIVAREYGIPAVMGTGVGTRHAAPTATSSPSTGMPGRARRTGRAMTMDDHRQAPRRAAQSSSA